MRSVVPTLFLMLLAVPVPAAAPLTFVIEAKNENDQLIFNHADTGTPLASNPIKVAVNDVVSVTVMPRSDLYVLETWQWTEAWEETIKQGKSEVRNRYSQPQSVDMHSRLGERIFLFLQLGNEPTKNQQLTSGQNPAVVIDRPGIVFASGKIEAFDATSVRSRFVRTRSDSQWIGAPQRISGSPSRSTVWYTLTITIHR